MWRRSDLLHPATIISSIALFVALGGVTYAAATIGSSQLKTGAVTRQKIKNKAVSPSKLANGAVTNEKLANNAITPSKLRTNAVTLGKIADGAVATSNLENGGVTESKLGSGSVTAPKLGAGAVGAAALGDGSVTTPKLANGSVTAAKLATPVLEGTGARLFTREELPTGQDVTLFTLPKLGKIEAACTGGVATTSFTNQSGVAVNVQATGVDNGPTDDPFLERSNPATAATVTHANTGTGGLETIQWQVSYTDAGGVDHGVTANLSMGAALTACVVTGDAFTTG